MSCLTLCDPMDLGKFQMGSAWGFPGGLDGEESACNAGDESSILSWEDPLEKGMTTHSSNLAWRIPWTEEPDGLQSIGLQRAGHG